MSFEEIWKEIKGLPDTAIMHIPGAIKVETKRRLAKMKPEEIERIIKSAIDEVNHGSVESLDKLINKRL